MSITKHVTLQKIVAHDFRYDHRIILLSLSTQRDVLYQKRWTCCCMKQPVVFKMLKTINQSRSRISIRYHIIANKRQINEHQVSDMWEENKEQRHTSMVSPSPYARTYVYTNTSDQHRTLADAYGCNLCIKWSQKT